MQPERRLDVLTGRHVIVAADRADRPIQPTRFEPPSFDNDPFAEGQEVQTPHERLSLRRISSRADQPGWLVRVVPNLYPAVSEESVDGVTASPERTLTGLSADVAATGVHEVVLECPDQRSCLAEFAVVEFARVLSAWQKRLQSISADAATSGVRAVNIFRNEGRPAGASLPHCHSQILATDFVSGLLADRTARESATRQKNGGSLFERWLESEVAAEQRLVGLRNWLTVVCPFASRVSRQIRFCPSASAGRFLYLSETQLLELSTAVLDVVRALQTIAGRFPHNLCLTLPPLDQPDAFPWMLDLLPRQQRIAGFELMTDVDVVTVTPEETAAQLRRCVTWTPLFDIAQPICPPDYCWQG